MRPYFVTPALAFILLSPCLNLRAQDGSILSAALDHRWRSQSIHIYGTPGVPDRDSLGATLIDEGLVLAFERVWASPGAFSWSPKIAAGLYRTFPSGKPLGADLVHLRGDLGPMFRYSLHPGADGLRFYAGFAFTGWLSFRMGEKEDEKFGGSQFNAISAGASGDIGIEYLRNGFLYSTGVNAGSSPVGSGGPLIRFGIGKSF